VRERDLHQQAANPWLIKLTAAYAHHGLRFRPLASLFLMMDDVRMIVDRLLSVIENGIAA
jgi:hypothetical protein